MYISIDIGGTNTRIASSRDLRDIFQEVKFSSSHDLKEQKKLIISGIDEVRTNEEVKGICVGVPGFVDTKNRRLNYIVNIPSLSNLSYAQLLDDKYPSDIILVENDAALAGLGEAVLGAGKDDEVVVFLTISTGVGGVRIAGKKIDPFQRHNEPGHMIIVEEGRYFETCRQNGCLAAYVSGTAFYDIYQVSPAECKDNGIWHDYAKKLSLGIINVISMWAPEVIVLGGSISNKFEEYFREPLFDELNKQNFFTLPKIVNAVLGDNSGIYGGFVLLSQKLKSPFSNFVKSAPHETMS